VKEESFEKLTRLKRIVGQMSIADKVAFVAEISSRLTPEMLKTSDGTHTFTEENLLSVAFGALLADGRDEFERMVGFYGGGYHSVLRKGMYHGKGDIPLNVWHKEMRRLYHIIRQNASDVKLPEVTEFSEDFVSANAWQLSKF
jgi:hypothetical protein